MNRKVIIIIGIVLLCVVVSSIFLTAGNKWTIIHTKGKRVWLASEAEKAVTVRWDYYAWDGVTGKRYLTYSETTIQPNEDFIMPLTNNIYLKITSDKVERVEEAKVLIKK